MNILIYKNIVARYFANVSYKQNCISGIILLLACLLWADTSAQQRPGYTQYSLNYFLINPALAGLNDNVDIKGGVRQQWTGWEGAPVTTHFSFHMPFKRLTDADSTGAGAATFFQQRTPQKSHHGAGVQIVSGKGALLSSTDLNLAYAYHIQLGPKAFLSTGIAAGFNTSRLSREEMKPETESDPALMATKGQESRLQASAGIWFQTPGFFAGLSAEQLTNFSDRNYVVNTSNSLNLLPHYYFTTGYRFNISEGFSIVPSGLLKRFQSSIYYDFNSKFFLKNRLWVEGTYRKDDFFSATLGLKLNTSTVLAYSYDFSTAKIQNQSIGSHEILLGFYLPR